MKNILKLSLAGLITGAALLAAAPAMAGGGHWSVNVGVGLGGGGYGGYGGYYAPPPVYYAPPVTYAPPPVVYGNVVPVYQPPPPVYYAPPPVVVYRSAPRYYPYYGGNVYYRSGLHYHGPRGHGHR